VPVDLTNITVTQTGDPTNIDGLTATSMQLAQNLAKSDIPRNCFTTMIYRFMTRRQDAALDAPFITSLDATFTQNGENLPATLVAYTQQPVFLNRVNVQ
jgi:hypothetical protein